MNNRLLFFVGLLGSLAISWGGLVLGAHKQLGGLAPFFDENESSSFPARPTGAAARGQLVYADLGCAACHTQQARRPGFGADQARGWGERQSVARDYIFQPRPQLGAARIGPDLANLAGRKPAAPTADELLNFLYAGGAHHPAYPFLFAERLAQVERTASAIKAGARDVVPSERALSLVAYLLSLNSTYDYPEARPLPAKPAPAHGAAPAAKKEAEKK